MDSKELRTKVGVAAKWSTLTELTAKLVAPITTMILARLLAPEAFGVVATVTMIVSFTDMFTDAGFQKYLIQHDFRDVDHEARSTTVAFWTNFGISIFLWIMVILFREPIAILVGNPGLGVVITVACVQLPISSFSSIQMALYRRDFDYKTLFLIRIIAICIPFLVTIPLAVLGWSYWALIVGSISGATVNAVILTIKSRWRPYLYYSFPLLKEMFSFSVWTMIEAISIWFTGWLDILIIGSALSLYYLGLYRTSLTMVGGIMGLITAATTPILFASLSRLQNDNMALNQLFLRIQRLVAFFIFPIGAGIFLYNDFATMIFLGDQWTQASDIIGIWALTSAIMIVLGHYSSELYRARGNPRLSFIAQVLHLIFLVPTCIISLRYGFWVLVYARALIRFQFVLVHLVIMKYVIKFPLGEMFSNIAQPFFFTILMGLFAVIMQYISSGFVWSLVSIGICIAVYLTMLGIFARNDFRRIVNLFYRRKAEQGEKNEWADY